MCGGKFLETPIHFFRLLQIPTLILTLLSNIHYSLLEMQWIECQNLHTQWPNNTLILFCLCNMQVYFFFQNSGLWILQIVFEFWVVTLACIPFIYEDRLLNFFLISGDYLLRSFIITDVIDTVCKWISKPFITLMLLVKESPSLTLFSFVLSFHFCPFLSHIAYPSQVLYNQWLVKSIPFRLNFVNSLKFWVWISSFEL